jgi:hypothetical protein
MSELNGVLERVKLATRHAGGGTVSDKAREALSGFRRKYFAIFVTLFAVLVATVILGMVGVAWYIREPVHMAVAGSAMGLTVGGTIEVMRRVWKEWSQAELLSILIEESSEETVTKVVDTLIGKL